MDNVNYKIAESTVKLSVRIPADLYRRLRILAAEPGETIQGLTKEAIEAGLALAIASRLARGTNEGTANGKAPAHKRHAGGNGKGTTKKLPPK
jgi:predicted DNA-binding protein